MSEPSVAPPVNGKEIVLVPSPQIEALTFQRDPQVVVDEARKAAKCLKKIIDSKPKHVKFNGEIYLENEDWLTVARFYGVTVRIREAKYVKFGEYPDPVTQGFEAIAEAFHVDRSEVISTAEAMCLNDENNWKTKPLFQLRSMAQTRASSRVLRQVFGWVVVLAGYKPTPAEEMIGGTNSPNALPLDICGDCGEDIWVTTELDAGKKKFGLSLCRVCFKAKLRKEQLTADRDLTPELKRSVNHVQQIRKQTIAGD